MLSDLISFLFVSTMLLSTKSSSLQPNQSKFKAGMMNPNQLLSTSHSTVKNQIISTLLPSTSIMTALLFATSTSTKADELSDTRKAQLEYQPALQGLGYGKVISVFCNRNTNLMEHRNLIFNILYSLEHIILITLKCLQDFNTKLPKREQGKNCNVMKCLLL